MSNLETPVLSARRLSAPLALAIVVLIGAVAAAIWLVAAAPGAGDQPAAKSITTEAEHSFYGGDAYTGIQNAAADTATAVVTGTNAQMRLASEIQEASAEQWAHLYRGLAALIVLLGIANLGRTLHSAEQSPKTYRDR